MSEETYVTQEGLNKLKQELTELKQIKRREVALRIETAKDFGDLSENAEYTSAKEEQAFIEGRIAELEQVLKNAIIIQETQSNGIVKVGSKIKIKDDGTVKEYKIVGSEEADPTQGLISNESPIGRAFLGRKLGEIVKIQVPKGAIRWKIIEIV